MALASLVLELELVKFCDARDPIFTGSPTTRTIARHKWADAFRTYVTPVTDHVATAAIVPPQSTIQIGFAAAVREAFFSTLRLDLGMSTRIAADDFADAWRAGMTAIAQGIGGTLPPSTTLHKFIAWLPTAPPRDIVDDRRDALALELDGLFSSPTITARPRLAAIAAAFHRATVELTATNTGGPTLSYR